MLKKTARIILAIFFSVTALLKIFSFPQFVLTVEAFHLLPLFLVLPFSIVIVLLELIAGVLLGLNMYTKQCSLLLLLLLSLFTAVIFINLLHNNIVDCGCFGTYFSSDISWWAVARNISFIFVLSWMTHVSDLPNR